MKKITALLLCILLFFNINIAFGYDSGLDSAIEKCGNYLISNVKNPSFGVTGGEWTVLGLARSGKTVPANYFANYYKSICSHISSCKGVLHRSKNTEYSRLILALTAIGKHPGNVSGYNLIMPLSDYEKTLKQGINGPVWALIALDSGNYNIPENSAVKVKATRDAYINYILSKQLKDGGWALSGEVAEADITGMVLCALSRYKGRGNVKSAIDKAIVKMSSAQTKTGGFASEDGESLESAACMLTALCSLGISPDDYRFVKNGNSLTDNICSYMLPSGGVSHSKKEMKENLMATEQAFYALVAAKRYYQGKKSLYDMSDVVKNVGMSYNYGALVDSSAIIKQLIAGLSKAAGIK